MRLVDVDKITPLTDFWFNLSNKEKAAVLNFLNSLPTEKCPDCGRILDDKNTSRFALNIDWGNETDE